MNSIFSKAPTIDIQRSRIPIHWNHKTTFSAGKLIPIMWSEVLPGDTWSVDCSFLCRMTTPIAPVMDDAWISTMFFFVPNRLVWNHWKEFMGENNESAWASEQEYTIPQIQAPVGATIRNGWSFGGVCDNFGVRPGVAGIQHTALPLRAYRLIWNEWFRAQALQAPKLIDFGDVENMNGYIDGVNYDKEHDLDALLPVNKPFDYFTSLLPAPQRGPAVLIPTAEYGIVSPVDSAFFSTYIADVIENQNDPRYSNIVNAMDNTIGLKNDFGNGYLITDEAGNVRVNTETPESSNSQPFIPNNLVSANVMGTIDELRAAFQIQKLLWRDGVGGGRYVELLKSHFGVTAPDASLQRPEYLGGDNVMITMNQVVQTSATDDTSPQGNTAAISKTIGKKHVIEKSFTEHGMIIGVACVRTHHSYQQGIDLAWLRKTRLDFYTPEFANLGDRPVPNKCIYFQTWGAEENDQIFGFSGAWDEYRYHPSTISGAFRHDYPGGSLDHWTYADYYDEMPYLSDEWIQETDVNINRTLAVQSDVADQFLLDVYYSANVDRPIPLHSQPGLADHF